MIGASAKLDVWESLLSLGLSLRFICIDSHLMSYWMQQSLSLSHPAARAFPLG